MNISLTTFISRRWWFPTIAVILGMLFLARLGFWQLDRLEQRRAANAITQAQLEASPLNLNEPNPAADLTQFPGRKVVAQGSYDFSQQLVVLSQTYNNEIGFYLLTPLRLTGTEQAVLVNRGWWPTADQTTVENEVLEGEVTVAGYVQLSQGLGDGRESTITADKEIYRIDIEAIQATLPYELLPIYVAEAPAGKKNLTLPYKIVPDLSLSEGSHLSYAWQWFSFSLMLGAIYIYYVNKNSAPTKE